ncbi:MAG TPA: hypothetical protein VK395_22930, partial [Gemmataceae bacterium]|nr:hypothetical protein [Gemmataceae bacterium]
MASRSSRRLLRRSPKLGHRGCRARLLVEQLEKRDLLSNLPVPALPHEPPGPLQKPAANSKTSTVSFPLVVGPDQSSSPVGQGYTPAQMQQAYGFNQITLPAGETFNDAGSGQT